MIISDIYDALTTWDRPYKKWCLQNGLFCILSFEDKEKLIDQDLLEIFVSAKLHKSCTVPKLDFSFPCLETAIMQDSFNCSYLAYMIGFSIDNKSI